MPYYYHDYDNEPIGGGNPYYRCVHCKRSDPSINGRLEGHDPDCAYRLQKEAEMQRLKELLEEANKRWIMDNPQVTY